jgi:hypothetical protein
MIVATLFALEFDLFNFAGQLTVPQRRITLAEAIFLTVLLALCIFAFAGYVRKGATSCAMLLREIRCVSSGRWRCKTL